MQSDNEVAGWFCLAIALICIVGCALSYLISLGDPPPKGDKE